MAATARQARAIGLAQCGTGLLLVAAPSQVAAATAGRGTRPHAAVVRLLGARMIAQGGAQLVRPSSATRRLAAFVEAAHASSMIGLAAVSARYRRPAVISAAVAGASAAVELAGTGRRRT